MLECSAFAASAVFQDSNSLQAPISEEEIKAALQNAEIVDPQEDSEFVLAQSSEQLEDDYFSETANQEMAESFESEQYNGVHETKTAQPFNVENEKSVDYMVLYTQQWLNQNYSKITGYTVTENGKIFMVYIDDMPNRTAENRFALMYSVYNGTEWSAPQPVLDDGTADFDAAVCPDDSGGVHLIWQNANTTFDSNVTLDSMSANMELQYAHWNGTSFDNQAAITANNQNFEMAHKIVSSGNNISVIWQQNSMNDPLSVDGTNTIYRKQFINNTWQDVEIVASDLSLTSSMDSSYVNGKNIVAYTAKTNKDTSTVNDLELFLFDGIKTEQISKDSIPDYSVNFLDDELYWIKDNKVISITKGDFNSQKVRFEFPNTSVSNIKLISNTNSGKAIVWEEENADGMAIYGATYNTETNSFGVVVPLAKDNGVVRGWDACMLPTGQIELSYCYADFLENSTDGKPYGTLRLIQKEAESFCDLYVDPIITYEGTIGANQSITLNAQVNNIGSQTVNQLKVNLLDETNTVIQTNTINQSVDVGKSLVVQIPYTLPDSINRTDLKVQVLPVDTDDVSLLDNEAIFSFGFADLSIENVEEIRDASTRQIKVKVKNNGFDSTDVGSLKLKADSCDGELVGTAEITTLAPNEEAYYTFNLDVSYSDSTVSEEPRLIYITAETNTIEGEYINNTLQYYVYPDYQINLQTNGAGGTVTGSGVFAKDSNVQVIAAANPGYVFQGWYENGVKILDADATYVFTVTKGRILEAKFAALDSCDIVAIATKTGVVDEKNHYLRGVARGDSVLDYFTATDDGSLCLIPHETYGNISATGTKVQVLSKSDTVVDVYEVIIPGDVNGDSAVDAFDAALLDHCIYDPAILKGAYWEAGDIN